MKRSSMILWVLLILSPVLAQGQERPTAEVVGDLPTEMEGTSTLFFLDLTAFFSSTSQILSHPTSQSFTIYLNPTTGIIHLPSQGHK